MKIAYQFRFIPLIAGIALTIISFVNYCGASIPYQDMTPELFQQYTRNTNAALLWLIISVAITLLSIIYLIVVKSKYKKQ